MGRYKVSTLKSKIDQMCLAVFYLTEKGLLRGGDNRQFFLKKRGRRPGTSTGLHSSEQQQRKHCDKDTKRQKPVLLSYFPEKTKIK